MTTINNIRDDLIAVFNGLRDGSIETKQAVEINNTAGKIISSAKVQLAYHALRDEAPEIPFLAASLKEAGSSSAPVLGPWNGLVTKHVIEG